MCNDCKATLLAYNNTNQVVAANSAISTPITSIEGCGIKFNNAATITRAGTYLVNISANALATTRPSFPGAEGSFSKPTAIR